MSLRPESRLVGDLAFWRLSWLLNVWAGVAEHGLVPEHRRAWLKMITALGYRSSYDGRMSTVQPRVFVSSVMEGFREMREAARLGIEDAAGVPVLVEDLPSLDETPRNACLDGVESCDVVVLVVGARGGWKAPSGKLAVEEEAEYARRLGMPLLVYLQDVPRDDGAEGLAAQLGDWVGGRFRTRFSTPEELRSLVRQGVERATSTMEYPVRNMDEMRELASEPLESADEVFLRIVLTPERDEEAIDPVRLQSDELPNEIYEVGHRKSIGFWSYSKAKSHEITDNRLVMRQMEHSHGEGPAECAALKLSENGTLVVETNVTGRIRRDRDRSGFGLESHVLAVEDLKGEIDRCFAFGSAVYELLDPCGRHRRFMYQATILGVGYRTFEWDPQPRSSYSIEMRGPEDEIMVLLDAPRLITREAVMAPDDEVPRLLALAERRLRSTH